MNFNPSTHKTSTTNYIKKQLQVSVTKLKCLTCSSPSLRFSLLTLTNVLHIVCPSKGYLWGRKIMRRCKCDRIPSTRCSFWKCFTKTHPQSHLYTPQKHTNTHIALSPKLIIIYHPWQFSSIMCFWTYPPHKTTYATHPAFVFTASHPTVSTPTKICSEKKRKKSITVVYPLYIVVCVHISINSKP